MNVIEWFKENGDRKEIRYRNGEPYIYEYNLENGLFINHPTASEQKELDKIRNEIELKILVKKLDAGQ